MTETVPETYASTHDNVPSIESDDSVDREPAVVARTPDGVPAGVAIYLTAADLRRLGIIPDGVQAVLPSIVNGAVLIDPVR